MLNLILSNKKNKQNTTKKSVAILGGTFDPVHKGHVQIIRHLLAEFDRVLVVPNKLSPFKLSSESASDKDRLKMLKLALEDFEGLEISDFELENGGISYSYITARHFSAAGVKLSYVIGSDMLYDLSKWKNFNELAKLTDFYIIPREGFVIEKNLIDDYRRLGARIKLSDMVCEDISSSLIKVAISLNRADEYLDENVLSYIKEWKLYSDYSYITDRFTEFSLRKERIEHTYRAIKEGIKLAKIHGISVSDTVTALLLHDIAKYTDVKKLSEEYGIIIEPDNTMPEACKHAFYGAQLAKKVFGIENETILKAIEQHTCGAPFMDDLSKIVAIADYTEEGRDFEGVDQIRRLATTDLDLCMELMLKNTIDHLKGKDIYRLTLDAYDYFCILNKTRAGLNM